MNRERASSLSRKIVCKNLDKRAWSDDKINSRNEFFRFIEMLFGVNENSLMHEMYNNYRKIIETMIRMIVNTFVINSYRYTTRFWNT